MLQKNILHACILLLSPLFAIAQQEEEPIVNTSQSIASDTIIAQISIEYQNTFPYFMFYTKNGWGVMDMQKKVIQPLIIANKPEIIYTDIGLLLRYKSENKTGLINLTNYYHIQPNFEQITIRHNRNGHESSCSAGIVQQKNKYGAIDLKTGKTIIARTSGLLWMIACAAVQSRL